MNRRRPSKALAHVEDLAGASDASVILLTVPEPPSLPSDIVGCPCEDDVWKNACQRYETGVRSYLFGKCADLEVKGIVASSILE